MEPEFDRYIGCLVGLAIGDALGTTLEFRPKGSFKPITEMVGGGRFGLRPGQWTDDTSMALCLAESLVERRGFDAADQMRRYVRWWHRDSIAMVRQAVRCRRDSGSGDPALPGKRGVFVKHANISRVNGAKRAEIR